MMGNSNASLSSHELTRNRTASVDNLETEKNCLVKKPVHNDAVTALAPVRQGMVITGCRDATIALHNIDTNECVLKWIGHEKEVTKLAYRYIKGTHLLVSGSRDSTIRLWKFNSPKSLHTFKGHEMAVSGLGIIDERMLCSGSRDNTIRKWDIETGKCVIVRKHPRNVVTHLTARCKDDNLLAQTGEDRELKLWDSRDLSLIHQFDQKHHIQMHCDLFPDGLYCLSCSNGFNGDGCEISPLQLWDLRQRKLLREFRGHEETVHCAVYMAQQVTWKKLVVSVSADQSVRIWNLDEGDCLWSEYVPSGGELLSCIGFNDGTVIACGLNSCLCHMRLIGRAGKPYLNTVSMQVQSTCSQSQYQF